jgi:predicted cupin superfamily sugar epimerase
MVYTAKYFIDKLGMQAHPEGGYFVETYRAGEYIPKEGLPVQYNGKRNFSTGIYFLMEGGFFSAFHKLKSDEMWHFYYGSAMVVYVIDISGNLRTIKVGNNVEVGEVFQAVVPAGCWFASRPLDKNSFSLVGCTVSPGFDFADFEMAKRDNLVAEYPQHKDLIIELTRE